MEHGIHIKDAISGERGETGVDIPSPSSHKVVRAHFTKLDFKEPPSITSPRQLPCLLLYNYSENRMLTKSSGKNLFYSLVKALE